MKTALRWLMLALLLVCPAWAADQPTSFPDITHEELVAAIKAHQVFLIDCNGSPSYNRGHIPGAVDFDTQEDNLAKLLPADKNALVVSYCRNPG